MTDRPHRPLTEFLLQTARDPQLHMDLTTDPQGTVHEHLADHPEAAQILLGGDPNAVAAYVQNEHAGASGITQHEIVVVHETIVLLICVIPPNG